jgi:hypothetical protein
MGKAQNRAAGKCYPATCTEGGEEMTDAALDAMVERANERVWEELNREDPKAKAAIALCNSALGCLTQAVALLGKAAETVECTPEEDRIISIANDLENLGCDITAQTKRMGA